MATVFLAISALVEPGENARHERSIYSRHGPSGALSGIEPRPPERSRWPLPASAEPIESWSRVDRELRAAVPDAAYRIYLEPLRPLGLDGGVLRVSA